MAKLLTHRSFRRSASIFGLGFALLGASLASPARAQPVQVASGEAFGTAVTLLGTIVSNKTASVGICTNQPQVNTNSLSGVNVPGILTVGAIETSARREELPGGFVRAQAEAEIAGVDLLGGLITTNAVTAMSVTETGLLGFSTNAGDSQLAAVTVLGLPLIVNPGPNTTVNVPLLGSLTLNEQTERIRAEGANHRTRMLHLVVNLNNPLVPLGTEITIGSAASGLQNTEIVLGGGAHGGWIKVGNIAVVDRLQRIGMPCIGTGGATWVNSGVGVLLPGVLEIGAVTTTIRGDTTLVSVDAEATAEIAGLSLLGGIVSAEALKARALLFGPPGFLERKTGGTQLVNLQVAGFPAIGDDVPLNTMVPLLGLGELWLKRRVDTPANNRVQMRLIELSVLEENALGLPIGTNIRVAFAQLFTREP